MVKISRRENFGKSGKLPDGKISPRNFPRDFRVFSGNRFVNRCEKVASGDFRENFSTIFSEFPGKSVGKISLFRKFPPEFPPEFPGGNLPHPRCLPAAINCKRIKIYRNAEENLSRKTRDGKISGRNFPEFPEIPEIGIFGFFQKRGVLGCNR